MDTDQQQAVAAARETVKQFARAELGIEIGQMPAHEGLLLVVAALITSIRAPEKKP